MEIGYAVFERVPIPGSLPEDRDLAFQEREP